MRIGPYMPWFRRIFGITVVALGACGAPDAELALDTVRQQQASAADGDIADVHPALRAHLIAHYDFERTSSGPAEQERDRGSSGTAIRLINGGAAMRVADGAHRLSTGSLQLRQNTPAAR